MNDGRAEESGRRGAEAVAETLAGAALDVERAIAVARMIFFAGIIASHFFLAPDRTPAKTAIVVSPLFAGILFSVFVLAAVRFPPGRSTLFVVSVTVDAVAAFCALLPYALWPAPGYVGILYVPDTTGIYLAIIAAGFRLSPGAAIWGAALNFSGVAVLTLIDRRVLGERFAARADTVSIYALFVMGFGMLAFIMAAHTRRLVQRGAVAAVRSDRAEQGLGAVLADHHDLRSLLAAATIGAERLTTELPSRGEGARDLRPLADGVANNMRRMGTIFRSIKARALHGMTALGEREPVTLAEVASHVAEHVAGSHPTIRLELDVPRNGPPVLVAGGEPTLHRILLNLLANACEGRGDAHASKVVLGAHPPADGVARIYVSDDGPGFSSEQLSRRSDARSGKPGGSGLGLTVVRGLVECSGGTLRLQNGPQGGALVTITLEEAPVRSA